VTGEAPADRLSLRARLLAVVAGLLALALVAAGALTLTSLRGQLQARVDEQLMAVASRQAFPTMLNGLRSDDSSNAVRHGPGGDPLPSSFVVLVGFDDGRRLGPFYDRADYGLPQLPHLTHAAAQEADRELVTVTGQDGDPWRAIVVPVSDRDLGVGAAVIALPMRDVQSTLQTVLARFLVLAVVLLGLLLLIGWFAVGRAFRPLREVQSVTTAFGAGDTSRRVVPQAPQTEVGRLGHSVNAMLDRIETTLDAREASEQRMRRFIGDASHELRTPLATLRGFAELHRMGAVSTPQDVAHTFRRIEDESTRMGALVEDLLALARLDEQRPLEREKVDLLVLVVDAAHDARALAPDRLVTVTGLDGSPAPGSALITGSEGQLRQVVTNLLANAVRHTPAGSPIELAVGRRGDAAVCQVVDHGPGIPAELAPRVFERFFRADASRTRSSGGSGLGLAIVHAIVHAHAGSARVLQTPGGGATLEIELPGSQALPSRDPGTSQQTALH